MVDEEGGAKVMSSEAWRLKAAAAEAWPQAGTAAVQGLPKVVSITLAVLSSRATEALKSARRDTLEALEAASSAWDLVQLTSRSTLDVWKRRVKMPRTVERVAKTKLTAPRTYATRSWKSHLALSESRRENPRSWSSFQVVGDVVGAAAVVERLVLGTVVEGAAVGGTRVVPDVADVDGDGRADLGGAGLVVGRVTTSSSSSCCSSVATVVVVVLAAADLVVVLLVEPVALLQTGHWTAHPNTLDADSL